ncbi:hypothetical protein BS47DRAFT_1371644 [Hydnum rufescens UP504]|uniref:NADP-dependent oxidoreductase domain-containing protein n=1 Tax=Hydnum rufescens UP504 TaxID=1448309 RepID=A0A9P6B2W9_9AGAM|nr:hypothetical protein BS47DRAFT_1371644 [Hydnum rufescens UP504]
MPRIGLGVYDMNNEEAYRCTKWALEAGYRLVDTAYWYENEASCGRAVLDFCAETGTPRSEIWYTTKLMHNHGREATHHAIRRSLKESGLDCIDLYLIHGPLGGPRARLESWEEIVKARDEGILRSIGVSNFGLKHLEEMRTAWETARTDGPGAEWAGVKPSVNQMDVHPFMARDAIVAFCRDHDIVVQAWAPLVRAMRFDHPVVLRIAKAHCKEPAQVLLRYSLQMDYAPIPKSVSNARIRSNIEVYDFELSNTEMKELHSLDERLVTDWEVTEAP